MERLKPTKNSCDSYNIEVIIWAFDGLCGMYTTLLSPLNSGSESKQNNNHNKDREERVVGFFPPGFPKKAMWHAFWLWIPSLPRLSF